MMGVNYTAYINDLPRGRMTRLLNYLGDESAQLQPRIGEKIFDNEESTLYRIDDITYFIREDIVNVSVYLEKV
jgi:hypothetical protein